MNGNISNQGGTTICPSDQDIRCCQLLECCDEQLRKELTRNASRTLTELSEIEVLAVMKMLAVREKNVMVARVRLHGMRQDQGEPIGAYGASRKVFVDTHNSVETVKPQ